jgi:Ring finger domain
MIILDTSAKAAASSIDIEKGHSAEFLAGTKSMILKAREGKEKSIKGENDTTYDLDDVYCEPADESHDCSNDDDGLPQCLICFEAFKNGDAVTTHCTDKVYHRHCIMEWLFKHNNCPYCRRPFFHAVTATSTDATAPPVSVASAIVATRGNENSSTSTPR